MGIYILLYLLFLLMGILNLTIQHKKFFNVIYIVFVAFIIVFSGTRFQIGLDWYRYIDIYKSSVDSSFFLPEKAEPLFTLFAKYCNKLQLTFIAFIFIIALISISIKAFVFYKYTTVPFVAFLFYFPFFINGEMGQIRQFLALSFILLSSIYIIKKQVFPFLFFVLIASLFHFSSILFMPVYFLINYIKKYWIYLGALILVVILNELNIFRFLSEHSDFFPTYLQQKILAYYDIENGVGIFSKTLFFRFFLIGVVLFFHYIKDIQMEDRTKIFLKIYWWGIVFFILFGSLPTLTDRGIVFFKIFDVFIITHLLVSLSKKYGIRHWIPILIFVISNVYYFRHTYHIFVKYGDLFIPYNSFIING